MPEDFEIKRKVLIKYHGKSKNPVIPEGVRKIGKNAFESSEIYTVMIPDSVTEIAEDAFAGSCIREITIPKSVEKIGKRAFSLCSDLRSFTLLGKLKSFDQWIFCACEKLSEIHIPDDMPKALGIYSGACKIKKVELLPTEKEVCDLAFNGCYGLKEVVIPEGVVRIGRGAFGCCNKLEKIVLPESVEEIDDRAFMSCYKLKTVTIPIVMREPWN